MADLCNRIGVEFVLGHALYMKATHGGKVKNDKLDSHKIALLLKGGMLLQAYVYPAEMRPTRDLLRRRMHLSRQRAHLIAQSRIRCISIICRLWVCAWAFGEAAVLFLKGSPPAQQWLQKQTSRHGKGKALAILSKKLGQTVYAMLKKNRCFDEARFMAHLK